MNNDLDLDVIEARANAAIGGAVFQAQTGRWVLEDVRDEFGPSRIVFAVADGGGKTQVADLSMAWDAEARGLHIAGMDPVTTLALVAELRSLRAENRRMADTLADTDGGGG